MTTNLIAEILLGGVCGLIGSLMIAIFINGFFILRVVTGFITGYMLAVIVDVNKDPRVAVAFIALMGLVVSHLVAITMDKYYVRR